jgi:hypothetical protein
MPECDVIFDPKLTLSTATDMATQPVKQLQSIRSQIVDLSITEAEAVQLEQLLQQSIAIVSKFDHEDHRFFKNRKKVTLEGLETELTRYQQGYWGQQEKVEKITRFNLARQQANLLLSTLLTTCRS